jgi:hypothetical protein
MKLWIDQRFSKVTLDRFIEIYFSEDFNNKVAPVSNLKSRKLVEEKVSPEGNRERRVRMEPAVPLPKAFDRLLGDDKRITYDEVSTYEASKHECRFRIDSKANERVKFEGIIRFVADGDGVRRIIDGVIEVKAPLGLGGMIEKFIETETQKGYEKIAKFLQRYIDEHP